MSDFEGITAAQRLVADLASMSAVKGLLKYIQPGPMAGIAAYVYPAIMWSRQSSMVWKGRYKGSTSGGG